MAETIQITIDTIEKHSPKKEKSTPTTPQTPSAKSRLSSNNSGKKERKSHKKEKEEDGEKRLSSNNSGKKERKSHLKAEDGEEGNEESKPRRKSHLKSDDNAPSEESTPDTPSRKRNVSHNNQEVKVYNKEIDKSTMVPDAWILDQFNDDQKQKIKQFREGPAAELITNEDNDLQITRWLVARKWDVNEATKMFVESKKWRQKDNMDNIFEWVNEIKPFKFLSTYWPISILPEQKAPRLRTYDGYLVVYERLTEMHPDILDIVTQEDMVKFHLYVQELCAREIRRICDEEKPGTYSGVVYVYDLVSLTLSHLTRSNYNLFQEFNVYDSNNYPETVRRVYLINSPSVFTVGWKVAKKFLDPVTIKKIVILGSDYQSELSKVIPPECIPKSFGGSLDYTITGGGSIKGIKKFA